MVLMNLSMGVGNRLRSKVGLGAVASLLLLVMAPAVAQTTPNLLVNGGFENNPPPNLGNNYPYPAAGWQVDSGAPINIVKVNGSTSYGNSGPALDAEIDTGVGVNQHYLDIVGSGSLYQTFTVPRCGGSDTAPREVSFSGYFSGRDGATNVTGGYISIQGGPYGAPELIRLNATGLDYRAWTQVSGVLQVTPGQVLTYVVQLPNPANFDNASMRFTDFACPSTTLTLRKEWSSATAGHTATITATRNGTVIDSLSSVASGTAGQTTVDGTPVTALAGDVIQLTEAITPTTATYYTAMRCEGDVTINGSTVTVGALGAAPTPIVCTVTNSLTAQPSLVMTKTAAVADTNGNGVEGDAGDVVTYEVTVTNNGNVAVNGVTITDPLPNLTPLVPIWPGTPGTLPVNTSVTATATYTITHGDVTTGQIANTATVTADPVGAVPVPIASASAAVPTRRPPATTGTVAVPVNHPLALLALVGLVGWFARRKIR